MPLIFTWLQIFQGLNSPLRSYRYKVDNVNTGSNPYQQFQSLLVNLNLRQLI
jgi:hypothetical protein